MMPVVLPPLNADGLLPVGRHAAGLDDLRALFVDNAPFSPAREQAWRAFILYTELLWERLPDTRLWVDGGFVTHKPWAAPHDVDVAILVGQDDWNALSASDRVQLLTRIENPETGECRVQPMGGLVDAHLVPLGSDAAAQVFDRIWSRVKLEDGSIHPTASKGYVEVQP
jgi:hypothetical protein